MTLRRAQHSLKMWWRKKFKSVTSNLNSLMKEFGKYMNSNWILIMSIKNQCTQNNAPGGTTSVLMGLRKKTEKFGRIVKLNQKNFSERNQALKTKLSQKEPTEQKTKNKQKNQPKTIICRLLNFKGKENIIKICKKLKGTCIFVNEDFSQDTLEYKK